MNGLDVLLPAPLKGDLYSFTTLDGKPMDLYIEAPTKVDALRRYQALPRGLQHGQVGDAIQVTPQSYKTATRIFFSAYFKSIGVA